MKKIILLLLCITLGPWGLAQVNSVAESPNPPVQSSVPTVKTAIVNKKEISIFPNPINNGIVNITLNGFKGTRTEIRILNVIGNEMYREVLNEMSDRYTKPINLNKLNLNNGVYYVKLQADDFSEFKKIIVN